MMLVKDSNMCFSETSCPQPRVENRTKRFIVSCIEIFIHVWHLILNSVSPIPFSNAHAVPLFNYICHKSLLHGFPIWSIWRSHNSKIPSVEMILRRLSIFKILKQWLRAKKTLSDHCTTLPAICSGSTLGESSLHFRPLLLQPPNRWSRFQMCQNFALKLYLWIKTLKS